VKSYFSPAFRCGGGSGHIYGVARGILDVLSSPDTEVGRGGCSESEYNADLRGRTRARMDDELRMALKGPALSLQFSAPVLRQTQISTAFGNRSSAFASALEQRTASEARHPFLHADHIIPGQRLSAAVSVLLLVFSTPNCGIEVEYAGGALGRAPSIHARLRRLATKPGEKCGLNQLSQPNQPSPSVSESVFAAAGATRRPRLYTNY